MPFLAKSSLEGLYHYYLPFPVACAISAKFNDEVKKKRREGKRRQEGWEEEEERKGEGKIDQKKEEYSICIIYKT